MLGISREFFGALNSRGVRYCHWKSNSHLSEALEGKTDLDLLVHPGDEELLRAALGEFRFLRVLSPPLKRFPGMEDHLGFDQQSGRLIHLHVHFQLVLGQRFIKNHHLPLEELVLAGRRLRDGVYVPAPEIELLLLVLRASMKTGLTDALRNTAKRILGRGGTVFPDSIDDEFRQLIAESSREQLLRAITDCGLPIPVESLTRFVDRFSSGRLRSGEVLRMKRTVLRRLRPFRREGPGKAVPRYAYLLIAQQPLLKGFFPSQKKVLPGPGLAVAVVGADGSGKSTLTNDLQRWLSWKMASSLHYYGIPKTRPIRGLDLLARATRACGAAGAGRVLGDARWVAIARCRAGVSEAVRRNVRRGGVAIIDRFPMIEFRTMESPMDGPRLVRGGGWPAGLFARLEAACYDRIRPPDLTIVLQAPLATLRQRKTDLDAETHAAKAEAVNRLVPHGSVVTVDASLPYAQVRLKAQQIIWERLVTYWPRGG